LRAVSALSPTSWSRTIPAPRTDGGSVTPAHSAQYRAQRHETHPPLTSLRPKRKALHTGGPFSLSRSRVVHAYSQGVPFLCACLASFWPIQTLRKSLSCNHLEMHVRIRTGDLYRVNLTNCFGISDLQGPAKESEGTLGAHALHPMRPHLCPPLRSRPLPFVGSGRSSPTWVPQRLPNCTRRAGTPEFRHRTISCNVPDLDCPGATGTPPIIKIARYQSLESQAVGDCDPLASDRTLADHLTDLLAVSVDRCDAPRHTSSEKLAHRQSQNGHRTETNPEKRVSVQNDTWR
jgi:hypothetical protein